MSNYEVVTSSPDSYPGVSGKVYTIHQKSDRVRGIPQYDDETIANAVCDALNKGHQLTAELRYMHNHVQQQAEVKTTFAPADEVLYYHVQDHLPVLVSMSSDAADRRSQVLAEAGYSEAVVTWMPVK